MLGPQNQKEEVAFKVIEHLKELDQNKDKKSK